MQRSGKQSHQRPDHDQAGHGLTRGVADEADPAGQRAEQRRAKAHGYERATRPASVDEKAAGDHGDRIDQQKRRIDRAHLRRRKGILVHDAIVAGDGHADAIEVAQKTQGHQQRQDVPADAGRLLLG